MREKHFRAIFSLGFAIAFAANLVSQTNVRPATPNASAETMKLLEFIYSISGKKTLTAEHEYMYKMSQSTDSISKLTGKYPAIWGGEFGFSDERHDVDNIKYRPWLLDEIIIQHSEGALITLTYHQASPVIGEPCDFKDGVQSKLTPEQYKELLTPGTKIYETWRGMIDKLAGMFSELQKRKIPVIFRPYHEMNGGWFWWSGTPGDSCCIKLYRQLFDYLTVKKGLTNIIWVWSPSSQKNNLMKDYYPGDKYVDIVGFDIYPSKDNATPEETFSTETYNTLLNFAGNKPMVIGECSTMPTIEILKKQPRWAWMMCWVELIFAGNTKENIIKNYNSDITITRDELKDMMK